MHCHTGQKDIKETLCLLALHEVAMKRLASLLALLVVWLATCAWIWDPYVVATGLYEVTGPGGESSLVRYDQWSDGHSTVTTLEGPANFVEVSPGSNVLDYRKDGSWVARIESSVANGYWQCIRLTHAVGWKIGVFRPEDG